MVYNVEDDVEASSVRHLATGVMTTVGVTVAGVLDLELLVPVLKELGKTHSRYKVGRCRFTR